MCGRRSSPRSRRVCLPEGSTPMCIGSSFTSRRLRLRQQGFERHHLPVWSGQVEIFVIRPWQETNDRHGCGRELARDVLRLLPEPRRVFSGRELYLKPEHGRADVDLAWIDFRDFDAEVLTRGPDAPADRVICSITSEGALIREAWSRGRLYTAGASASSSFRLGPLATPRLDWRRPDGDSPILRSGAPAAPCAFGIDDLSTALG